MPVTRRIEPVPILLLSLLLLNGCSFTKPSEPLPLIVVPKGWFLSLNNTYIPLIKAEENKKAYSLSFDRSTKNPTDDYYIKIAESVFPQREMILAATRQLNDDDVPLKSWYFERLWWFEEYQDNRIPFSLTADTVNFYLDRYRNAKAALKQRLSADPWKASNQNRIQFSYTAEVYKAAPPKPLNVTETTQNTDNDDTEVRVVLKMIWYEFCGQPCGWGFEKRREVTFAGPKRMSAIQGDGLFTKWISNRQTPYPPEQWVTF